VSLRHDASLREADSIITLKLEEVLVRRLKSDNQIHGQLPVANAYVYPKNY
jgi:hypothetical protein